jgi:2-aminoethylphosphonate-pyruvate transaminase
MKPKAYVLMNPGPVVTDPRVREALGGADMCHREPEFATLMTDVRDKITHVCGGDQDWGTVMFTGSGTAALEATISSVVPDDGKLLVLDNGHYGQRLAEIAAVHHIPLRTIEHGWGVPIDLGRLESALAGDPAISHVGLVHHETSTGMLNPLRQVGEIVARHGRSLLVDAISSLGGELLDVKTEHIDWCMGTANKCLEGVPGISFVCAPKAKIEALASGPKRTYYLDVHSQYIAQERSKAPAFTPAVQTFLALDEALDLMLAEGVARRTARYGALASELRAGLEELGLRLLLPAEQRCNTLTAIYLPAGIAYEPLHDRLKAAGFVIYAGQDALRQNVFRLANMGQITSADMARFLQALRSSLDDLQSRAAA